MGDHVAAAPAGGVRQAAEPNVGLPVPERCAERRQATVGSARCGSSSRRPGGSGSAAPRRCCRAFSRTRGEHELEVVFFEPGSWPEELQAAGLWVSVISRRPASPAPPVGRHGHRARAHLPRAPTRRDPQLVGENAPVRLARRRSRRHDRPGGLVAAGDPRADMAGPGGDAAAGGRDRLLLAGVRRRPGAAVSRRPTFAVAAGSPPPDPHPYRRRSTSPRTSRSSASWAAAAVEGAGSAAARPGAPPRQGPEMHAVIVGRDSYGLSPEYAASLPIRSPTNWASPAR